MKTIVQYDVNELKVAVDMVLQFNAFVRTQKISAEYVQQSLLNTMQMFRHEHVNTVGTFGVIIQVNDSETIGDEKILYVDFAFSVSTFQDSEYNDDAPEHYAKLTVAEHDEVVDNRGADDTNPFRGAIADEE
jgi:hypothetical protein